MGEAVTRALVLDFGGVISASPFEAFAREFYTTVKPAYVLA